MNRKKIKILTLILLFFVSTTGLPLTVHLCSMNKYSSHDDCEVHLKDVKKVEEDSCCSMEDETEGVTISVPDMNDCCQFTVMEVRVKDKFLSVKVENYESNLIQIIIINNDADLFDDFIDLTNNYSTDSSPPSLIDNHIYLNNSTFLI